MSMNFSSGMNQIKTENKKGKLYFTVLGMK